MLYCHLALSWFKEVLSYINGDKTRHNNISVGDVTINYNIMVCAIKPLTVLLKPLGAYRGRHLLEFLKTIGSGVIAQSYFHHHLSS